MAIVTAENLTKHYGTGANLTKALDGVSLKIIEGEFAAIVGASGSGFFNVTATTGIYTELLVGSVSCV